MKEEKMSPNPGKGKIVYEGGEHIHLEPVCEYDNFSEESFPDLNKDEGLSDEVQRQRATQDEIYFYGKYEKYWGDWD